MKKIWAYDSINGSYESFDHMFWVYDPINGSYEFFDNISDRDELVDDLISDCKDDDGFWEDDIVTGIEIGESITTHKVTQIDFIERPYDDELDEDNYDKNGTYWGEYDYMCDYAVKKIEGKKVKE